MSWITLCLGVVIVLVRTVAHPTPAPPGQLKAVVNGGATYYYDNYPPAPGGGGSAQDKGTQNSVYYGYFPPGAHFHQYYNNHPYLAVDPPPYNYHDDYNPNGDGLYTDYYGDDNPAPDHGYNGDVQTEDNGQRQDGSDSVGQVEDVVHGVSDGGDRKGGDEGDGTDWRKHFGIGEDEGGNLQVDNHDDIQRPIHNYPHQPEHMETRRTDLETTTPTPKTTASPEGANRYRNIAQSVSECGPVGQMICDPALPCHYRHCVPAIPGSDTYQHGLVRPCPRGTAIRTDCMSVGGTPCANITNSCDAALHVAPQDVPSTEPLKEKYRPFSTQSYMTKSNNPYNTPEDTPPSPTRSPYTTHQPHTTRSGLIHTAPASEHPIHTTIKPTQSPYTLPRETPPYHTFPSETMPPPTYPSGTSRVQDTSKPTQTTKSASTAGSSPPDWYMKYLLGEGDQMMQGSDEEEGFVNAAVETTQPPRPSTNAGPMVDESEPSETPKSGLSEPTSGSVPNWYAQFFRMLDAYRASQHGPHETGDGESDTPVGGTGHPPYGAYGVFDPLSTKPTPAIQPYPQLPSVGSEQNNQDAQPETETTDEPFESVNVYDDNQQYYDNNYFYQNYQWYDY